MSVAASINILLKGNTKDLESKLAAVERKFRSFVGMFQTSFFSKDVFKQEFEQLEKLGRIAERLDIPAEKLAGLRAAAEAADLSLGDLASGMQKMLVAVSGSGDPLKKAATDSIFNKLRLNAEQLKRLSPEQQFSAIADALQQVESVADRVNIARSLFGKGGVPLLNVLQQGSKGLKEWQTFAEKTGTALNSMDLSKIERADRTIKAMFQGFKGLVDQVLVALAPSIEKLGKLFLYLSQTVLPFLKSHAELLVTLIKLVIAYKAAVWAVVVAERALAIANAIKIAITSESWAALARLAAGAVVAGAAVAGIAVAFDKVTDAINKMDDIKIPEIPDLPGLADFAGKGIGKQHPGALIKGSVEAYSAIVNAGGSPMSKIEQHTKRTAVATELANKRPAAVRIAPANLGGR